jgi:N-methylhydantoinase A/oxoprolinase/acetone carboxylase beta subunit
MTNTFEIARIHRFKRGSGLPVRVPAIDLIEIGAGGGSTAWVDEMGLLKVGPHSAGADPGPACYGLGGEQPTVTDANLVLGYLNPDYFLGGRMALDVEAAEQAIKPLAAELDLSLLDTARGIHQIVNQNMISATRVHIAERGEDPRELALLAFGGAGPIHAYAIARALKMPGFICPSAAGVASALGLLTAPVSFDLARTYTGAITQESLAELDQVFEELREEGRRRLAEAGVSGEEMRFELSADMRHRGQGHDISVDLPWPRLQDIDINTELRPHFYREYEALYGHAHEELALEIMTCRVRARGPAPNVALPQAEAHDSSLETAKKGLRPAYITEAEKLVDVPVYERTLLPAGTELDGPAVLEEAHSTTFMGPDCLGRIDEHANLIVELLD